MADGAGARRSRQCAVWRAELRLDAAAVRDRWSALLQVPQLIARLLWPEPEFQQQHWRSMLLPATNHWRWRQRCPVYQSRQGSGGERFAPEAQFQLARR